MVKSEVVNSSERMQQILESLSGDELIAILPYGPPEDYMYLIIYREEK